MPKIYPVTLNYGILVNIYRIIKDIYNCKYFLNILFVNIGSRVIETLSVKCKFTAKPLS